MNENESLMKSRGENKVWKSVTAKEGSKKKISSTQIGQQLIFDEALKIHAEVSDWIHNKTGKSYRKELLDYFVDEDFILQKIVETMLVLSGDIEGIYETEDTKGKNRRKKIKTVKDRILPELSFENTWRFLEVVVDLSEYFKIEKLLSRDNESFKWSVKYVCTLSKTIVSKLSLASAEAFYPLPMLKKPIDWKFNEEDNSIVGGYEHFQYSLVRANFWNVDYTKYSQDIFDRANYIQQTPWTVNEGVLSQLKRDVKLPMKSNFVKMEYPDATESQWDIDLKSNEHGLSEEKEKELLGIRKIFTEQSRLYNAERGDYESAVGKYRAVKLAMQIAEKYIGQTIYFPHNYDFRGRIYPISIGLSPQGSDAVKALLLYKNTEALTNAGTEWNWAYLASLYGDDKLPFAERIERGKDLIDADYMEADEPYQFLSHQIELNKFVNDETYIPNTRIHLDACNSGSQFTSAITGDKAGCLATNVLPTYDENGDISRQDAYLLVAEKAVEQTRNLIPLSSTDEETEILEFLLDLLVNNGRKICKTPTMVSNYGGTAAGRADILWEMFRELKCDHKYITKKNAHLFSTIIGDSIQGVLNGGKAFELYVQKMSNCISRGNNPITWETSDGFHVIHKKNKELKCKKVSCILPGSRRQTKITKKLYSDQLSSAKMRSAISPNYIHSLDAELLRNVSKRMQSEGIENSDWIHDSFGCHPNHVDKMLQFSKEEFKALVLRKPLLVLHENLLGQVGEDKDSQKALKKIHLPKFEGFKVEDEIEKLMDSDWFFS
jgi:DNA-directed RNA polymerase